MRGDNAAGPQRRQVFRPDIYRMGGAVSRQYQGVPYIFLLTKKHIVHNVWAGYDESFDKGIIKA